MAIHAKAAKLVLMTAAVGLGACSAESAKTPPAPIIDQRAIAALKVMSDTLAAAGSVSFNAQSSVAVASPGGQWVHVFGASHVQMQRPDKLHVETSGDLFAHNFYFDGKKLTMYAPTEKLYAQDDIAGNVDQIIFQIFDKHGIYFPFADVLRSDPSLSMGRTFISAQLVGESAVGGVKTQHLAFTADGIEWEIWIGNDDHLPRLLNVTYSDVKGNPTCSVAFADWDLKTQAPDNAFVFVPPPGAARIDFHKIEPSTTQPR